MDEFAAVSKRPQVSMSCMTAVYSFTYYSSYETLSYESLKMLSVRGEETLANTMTV